MAIVWGELKEQHCWCWWFCRNPVRPNKWQNATLWIPIQLNSCDPIETGTDWQSQSVFIKICFVCDEIITVINWINKVASINSIAFVFRLLFTYLNCFCGHEIGLTFQVVCNLRENVENQVDEEWRTTRDYSTSNHFGQNQTEIRVRQMCQLKAFSVCHFVRLWAASCHNGNIINSKKNAKKNITKIILT